MRRVLGCEAKHAGIAIWHFANEGISSPVRALNFFHIVSTQLIQIKDTVAFEIWNTKFISLSIIYPYNSKKLCLYDVLGAGLDRARPKSPPRPKFEILRGVTAGDFCFEKCSNFDQKVFNKVSSTLNP
jgi:hypothetical protein